MTNKTTAESKPIQIPTQILAIAEEINALSDNGGLEQSSLEFLLRAVLSVDRSARKLYW